MKNFTEMKKALLVFIIFTGQVVFTQPKFAVSVFGGYNLPLGDMKGDFPDNILTDTIDFYTAKTYLLKKGYGFGVNLKYTYDTSSQLRVIGGFRYNAFSQKMDYTTLTGKSSISNTMNIFTILAGLSYEFSPKKGFNPYVGLDLNANFYSGTIEWSGDTLSTLDRTSDTRFGVTVSAGAEYMLSKTFGVNAGARYTFANLIGRKKQTSSSSGTNNDTGGSGSQTIGEISLNDEDSSTGKSKTINFAQFFAGFTYYFR